MLSLRFLSLFFIFLSSVLGNCFASGLTSTSASLTLFSAQLLFSFQSHLISIFHSPKGHHAHLILNVISQTIHVSGNLFIIAFPMTCSDVYPVELFSVFFHCHQLLSQILHPPKQSDLIILGYKFGFHLCNHSIPALDFLLALAASVSLQFIPP
jgi:hypothetical protein